MQVEGKLKPWLAKHGLDSLQGLWTRLHIEPGWEAALEAALRERIGALQVGRLETVQAFAADAPPVRLAFYTPPSGAIANTHRTLPRLSDLLRLGDASLEALLNDWLEGVYTAADLDAALAARANLTHGEIIMTRDGHAVSQYAVSFYAPDSEQAGLLARAQEIENLDRQVRAQAVIADEAAARWCAPRRRTPMPRSASRSPPRRRRCAVACAPAAGRAAAPVATGRADRRAARAARREFAAIDEQLAELAGAAPPGSGASRSWTCELGAAQERHAELEEAQAPPSGRSPRRAQQLRALERSRHEAQFALRTLASRRAELERADRDRGRADRRQRASEAALHDELANA